MVPRDVFFEAIINEIMSGDGRYRQAEEDNMIELLMEEGQLPQTIEECEELYRGLCDMVKEYFLQDSTEWVASRSFIDKYWLGKALFDERTNAVMLVFEYEVERPATPF